MLTRLGLEAQDALDEFPSDATRAFSRYYPGADTWGTLAYEDQWPQRGDYDMNDVVMHYRTREVMNASRQVVGLSIDYALQARGGLLNSGFGVHLPGVAAGQVASATLSTAGGAAKPLASEAGQTDATFIVTPSVQAQMPIPAAGNCPYVNTEAGCPTVAAVPYHLEVVFAPGKDQVLGGETEAVRSGSARAVIAIRHRIEGRSLARHSSCYLEIPGAGEGFAAFGQHGVIPG